METLYGCRECGRKISKVEADAEGICARCRRQGVHVDDGRGNGAPAVRLRQMNPAATTTDLDDAKPLRPILKPRGTASTPQLKTLGRPKAKPQIARPTPAPVAPAPPAAAEVVEAPPPRAERQQPERPNLRLRRSAEREQEEQRQQQLYMVSLGRSGLMRREQLLGPLTWDELGGMVRDGELLPGHKVRTTEEDEWMIAGQLDDLFNSANLQALQVRAERQERAAIAASNREADTRGFFGTENAVLNSMGPAGGVLLMAVAAIWFFVGLSEGILYFYPPILFLVGLFGMFRG